jgi:hypothetical protein
MINNLCIKVIALMSVSFLNYSSSMAVAPSKDHLKVYSENKISWAPLLFSNYIIEGKVKSISLQNENYNITLIDSEFKKGEALNKQIELYFDVENWDKNSVKKYLNAIDETSIGERIMVFSTYFHNGKYVLYPNEIVRSKNINKVDKSVRIINKVLSMARDYRLEIENSSSQEVIVGFWETEKKIKNGKLFGEGIKELINKGELYSLLIYSQIAYSKEYDDKFLKKIKKYDFFKKYRPKNSIELYDAALSEIYGFKPYYPIGHDMNKQAMVVTNWRAFLWLMNEGQELISGEN